MLDANAKKILKLKFPNTPIVAPRICRSKMGPPKGCYRTNKQLLALKRGAVPAGKVLNPYGKSGNTQRGRYRATYFKLKLKPAWRPEALKRKRIKLQIKKAIALEAHELQQIARENATLAMNTLTEIAKNKRAPEATRIAASSVILDRAYGKASQTSITASIGNGKNSDLDSTELDRRVKQALKRVEELTDRTRKAPASPKRPVDIRKYN